MKPQLAETNKRPKATGAEAAPSLEEELAAAIHGAFEVAVEVAVREVTKLVGQATGAVYGEMRRQNESLKQRLQRAEEMLDSARMEESGGGGSPFTDRVLDATERAEHPRLFIEHCRESPGGDSPRPGHRRARPSPDSQHEEQRSGDGCSAACDALPEEVCVEISRLCEVKVHGIDQPCTERSSPTLPNGECESTLKHFMVKQEKPEEGDSLDLMKVEDFMTAVQSKVLEEWKPEGLDIQCQDSTASLSCTRLAQDFPNIFQSDEPPPIPEEPPPAYGVHMRTGHTLTDLYACKSCGQAFHLSSLLRRHYGQCQQKLQQCCQQPGDGGRRTRLQLYPPGCSPFLCTVCNREFNRMENLKTHLRIHTGERPYTCSVCSKCFRHSGALTRHFRIHTGEKPYVCAQCGKSFRNCGGLKFHQRSHSKQLK